MKLGQFLQIGKKMKNMRVSSGLSQKDMAAKLEIPVPTYSNYENGYAEPPVEVVRNVCEILNIKLEDLLELDVGTCGINLDHINTLIRTMDNSGQYFVDSLIRQFVRMSEKEQRFLLGVANLIVEDVEKGEL